MIIIYDRDKVSKEKIIKYVKNKLVTDIVLANIEDATYELMTEESNLFQELNKLAGPIILYGRCSDRSAKFLQPFKIFARKDACWVESIFFKNFQSLYFYLYFRSERFLIRRMNLFK
ncbi:MAG: hypothetical protein UU93_C0018G0007 [Candidatus Amesbacteria bacterium GW2011_GWA2_42_12]|uniref:Uncharacterized protein n=1 Tax=Candidatus Amesbacteria bacterium GW2011_GWA2_42_12 TaxID=1618356 RepID=A0A0G1B1H6_9BACT|nr:MAG: hypothetical protein UU93_C0018G0007 [Candidatus Amesbacteria bacterium GW2011_GWA2_42_12]